MRRDKLDTQLGHASILYVPDALLRMRTGPARAFSVSSASDRDPWTPVNSGSRTLVMKPARLACKDLSPQALWKFNFEVGRTTKRKPLLLLRLFGLLLLRLDARALS